MIVKGQEKMYVGQLGEHNYGVKKACVGHDNGDVSYHASCTKIGRVLPIRIQKLHIRENP